MTNREILEAFELQIVNAGISNVAFLNKKPSFKPSAVRKYLQISELFIEKSKIAHCSNKVGFLAVNLFFKEFTGAVEYLDDAEQVAGFFKSKNFNGIAIGNTDDDEPKVGKVIKSRNKEGWMFIPIIIYFEIV